MSLPRDFLAEVEAELEPARRALRESAEEWAALEELRERAAAVSRALRRPASVVDVLESAYDEDERARIAALVGILRRERAGHNPHK
jgi:hypothetical protein